MRLFERASRGLIGHFNYVQIGVIKMRQIYTDVSVTTKGLCYQYTFTKCGPT